MTEKQVRRLIKDIATWDEFMEFMVGKTMSAYKNGETNYYDTDVRLFISSR